MPLATTGHTMTLVGTEPSWAVAFFMAVDDGADPPKSVRVVATPECLAAIDPKGAVDSQNAIEVAHGDRMRIEAAASRKYDREGVDANGEIVLRARDTP